MLGATILHCDELVGTEPHHTGADEELGEEDGAVSVEVETA